MSSTFWKRWRIVFMLKYMLDCESALCSGFIMWRVFLLQILKSQVFDGNKRRSSVFADSLIALHTVISCLHSHMFYDNRNSFEVPVCHETLVRTQSGCFTETAWTFTKVMPLSTDSTPSWTANPMMHCCCRISGGLLLFPWCPLCIRRLGAASNFDVHWQEASWVAVLLGLGSRM